ncbi:hypothetical protein Dimus_000876, partial [Dionaea muscipula]
MKLSFSLAAGRCWRGGGEVLTVAMMVDWPGGRWIWMMEAVRVPVLCWWFVVGQRRWLLSWRRLGSGSGSVVDGVVEVKRCWWWPSAPARRPWRRCCRPLGQMMKMMANLALRPTDEEDDEPASLFPIIDL